MPEMKIIRGLNHTATHAELMVFGGRSVCACGASVEIDPLSRRLQHEKEQDKWLEIVEADEQLQGVPPKV
jgi:hypothetical protein